MAYTKNMRRRLGFGVGFVRGLGSVADIYTVRHYWHSLLECESDMQAMRGDWERVGDDLRNVVTREHGKTAPKHTRAA